MFTRQLGHVRQLLAAAIEPEGRQVVTFQQRAEVVADKRAGRRAVPKSPAQHIEIQPRAPRQEESLGCGDGLAKPQQVNQQLDQIPGARAADGAAAIAVAGGSYGIVSATSSSSPAAASSSSSTSSSGFAHAPGSGGGGPNALSGPAAGGAAG